MAEFTAVRDMYIYGLAIDTADWAWAEVGKWKPFAREVVGKQLCRAMDSVGANMVEGGARHGTADSVYFFIVARASAEEGIFWIERATARGLMDADAQERIESLKQIVRGLNNLISHRRSHPRAPAIQERR